MALLYPTVLYPSVTHIKASFLKEKGIRALVLDVDNTLTTHNNPLPDQRVLAWLKEMKSSGIHLVILSNNREHRVRRFAEKLGLDYTANAAKPLTFGFQRTARRLGLRPEELAIVGDQIFTDILGGNLFGAHSILVKPMEPETGPFFRLKRRAERAVLRRYRTQGR